MKLIRPEDASLLALLAEHPGLPEREFQKFLGQIKSLDAKRVASALRIKRGKSGSDKAATALLEWADGNRKGRRIA